ncbi:hypothetical protein ACJMK2_032686 [Sinanodonta woodiana]|uniref:Uncharacterized protein n=1 Tax=Sinanodonta woodiana TaxID=1069815 RepID=A0ABD3X2I0_SINWO
MRPKEQRDFEFALDTVSPTNFFGKTFILAVKIWYVNAAIKIIRAVVSSLYIRLCQEKRTCNKAAATGVHLCQDGKKKDYKKICFIACNYIFKALKRLIQSPPPVKGIVSSHCILLAFQWVYPGVIIHAYAFHLGQAMWRKLQELGLIVINIKQKIKKMALPFLPAENVVPAFAHLTDQSKIISLLYSWIDYKKQIQARIFSVWKEHPNGIISSK